MGKHHHGKRQSVASEPQTAPPAVETQEAPEAATCDTPPVAAEVKTEGSIAEMAANEAADHGSGDDSSSVEPAEAKAAEIDAEPEAVSAEIAGIARVAHEVNRAYCLAIGDDSQPDWTLAPAWQKASAFKGVQFHLANPDASPSASHESWLAEKERDGWTYGRMKDPELKQHPCFVPYEQLPVEQRAKDYLFTAVCRELSSLIMQTLPVVATQDPEPPADPQPEDEDRIDFGDANTLAAMAAASMGFGTTTRAICLSPNWLGAGGLDDITKRANIAAAFVRGNPDAPDDALPIHLKRAGLGDVPEIAPRQRAAWRIFRFALKALDDCAREEKALAEPAAAQHGGGMATPVRPETGHGFAASGFKPG